MNHFEITKKDEEISVERMDFLRWSANWINKDKLDENVSFHVFEIGLILQILGFNVTHFEKLKEFSKNYGPKIEHANIQIGITCSSSGIRTVFEKNENACNCPKFQETSAQIDPVNAMQSDELLRQLFPKLNDKTKILMGLLHNVHHLIRDEMRSDIVIVSDGSQSLVQTDDPVVGEEGWEVDPRTTPPTGTSSPLTNHLTSANMFGSAEERDVLLNEFLASIQSNMDSAYEVMNSHRNQGTKKTAAAAASDISLKNYERELRGPQQCQTKLPVVKENVRTNTRRAPTQSSGTRAPTPQPPSNIPNLNTNSTPNRFKPRKPADKTGKNARL